MWNVQASDDGGYTAWALSNFTFTISAGASDTCSCPAGVWSMDLSDNCHITVTCDLDGLGGLVMNGTGSMSCDENGRIIVDYWDFKPTSASTFQLNCIDLVE